MTLSKIELLQKAFHNIKNLLKKNSVSCFFFNNSLQLYTTCSQDLFSHNSSFPMKFNMSHTDLYNEIDNVKCRNITDFSMISCGIKTFEENMNLTETVKIIISDGFHTEYSKPIEEIRDFLVKKFDYAIGLGNHDTDFDKIFLESIAENFNFHCVTQPFNFEFLRDASPEYIHLPPNSKILTSEEIYMEALQEKPKELESYSIENKGIYYENRKYQVEETNVPLKKHFLFFIDISGSMDNRILQSSIVTNYYRNCNFLIQSTGDMWRRIPIYFSQDITIITSDAIDFEKQEQENDTDTMIRIVTKLKDLKEDVTKKKIDYLVKYEEEVQKLGNVKFQKYFQKQYYSMLSNAEKIYLRLSKTFPNISTKVCEPIENIQSFSRHCIICYENDRTELFSCLHFVCCYRCCLETIGNKLIAECPICREPISWIGSCNYRANKCVHCSKNVPSVYSYPSGEITLCRTCFQDSEDTVQIPFFFT